MRWRPDPKRSDQKQCPQHANRLQASPDAQGMPALSESLHLLQHVFGYHVSLQMHTSCCHGSQSVRPQQAGPYVGAAREGYVAGQGGAPGEGVVKNVLKFEAMLWVLQR